MEFKSIITIDEGISFQNGTIKNVESEIKELFPNRDFVEIHEKGKSYLLHADYIILLTFR